MNPAVGVSLRQRRITQIQNSPQVRRARTGQGHTLEENQLQAEQENQRDRGTSNIGTPSDAIIPAPTGATENFRRPQSPIP